MGRIYPLYWYKAKIVMHVWVFGANGQVGRSLQKVVNQSEHTSGLSFSFFTKQEVDITQRESLFEKLESRSCDVLINCAAYTKVDLAEQERELAYLVNDHGVQNLVALAKLHTAVLLHISTDYVFSGNAVSPYTEDEHPDPQSVYGASKLAGESFVSANLPQSIVLRTAWVFSEYPPNFLQTMLRLATTHKQLNVVNDQIGAPTYAGHIAQALLHIVLRLKNTPENVPFGLYHFAGDKKVSWYEFAKAIFSRYQHQYGHAPTLNAILSEDYPQAAKRPIYSVLDCQKIQHDFGISPSDWQSALDNILNQQHVD